MTEPVQLRDANRAADADVVAELERALEMARAGELRSVVIAGSLVGHRTFTSFATDDLSQEIALTSFLNHTLCASMRETRE